MAEGRDPGISGKVVELDSTVCFGGQHLGPPDILGWLMRSEEIAARVQYHSGSRTVQLSERAQAIADELSDAFGETRRPVAVLDQTTLGSHIFPKPQEIQIRKDWLQRIDEDHFKFALAAIFAINQRNQKYTTGRLVHASIWASAIAIFAMILGGSHLSPPYRYAGWTSAIALTIAVCVIPAVLAGKNAQAYAFEQALRVTGDYDAARRFVTDQQTWSGPLNRFGRSERQIAKTIAVLDSAAQRVGLRSIR